MILYEYPFNERVRTYLRIERLFTRLTELVRRSPALDHHFALATMFEIMDVCTRADLKSEVIKDLDRQKHALDAYRDNPAIAQDILDAVIGQVDGCYTALTATAGKPGQALTENDWLMSIRSRVAIPGGCFEFDLPAYYAWQHKPDEQRQQDLTRWAATLAPLAQSISLLLKLLRESGMPQKVIASGGQFQQNLPSGKTFQLLRMALDPALGLIPEISGNRLLVSIRLLRQSNDDHLQPEREDASFDLTLCC